MNLDPPWGVGIVNYLFSYNMSSDNIKEITLTPITTNPNVPPPIDLEIQVNLRGDFVGLFVWNIEHNLNNLWDLMKSQEGTEEGQKYLYLESKKEIKKLINRFFPGVSHLKNYTNISDDVWATYLEQAIIKEYEDSYSGREFGRSVTYQVRIFLRRYFRSPEGKARLQQLIDDDWLSDLLTEKGIHAANQYKRTFEN